MTSRSAEPTDEPSTEGERWARRELGALARARWRPRAVLGFLGASHERALATARRRAGLTGQARRWMLAGGLAWPLAARALPGTAIARARASGPVSWAGCAVMLQWHLGMLETPDGHEVRLGAADSLTLLRAWLIPAVAHGPAPWLALLGGVTDVADGIVARATRCTRLGRDLEGLVDACFAAAILRSVRRAGGVSPRAARLEQARLLGGAGYATVAYFVAGHAPDPVRRASSRDTAPIRFAGLVAAGFGARRLADGLLVLGTALGVVQFACGWARA